MLRAGASVVRIAGRTSRSGRTTSTDSLGAAAPADDFNVTMQPKRPVAPAAPPRTEIAPMAKATKKAATKKKPAAKKSAAKKTTAKKKTAKPKTKSSASKVTVKKKAAPKKAAP